MHVHCFKLQLEVHMAGGPQNIILTVFFNFWAPGGSVFLIKLFYYDLF